ncbi:alpha/beta hydrolase [Streptomyces sp. NPDC005438]|uniref:alpha/beta fold hydrolase n=1 Tax=Streptomyces sp. NPDC005438 TaxID=3156880 RepID=UPI0033B44D63
MSNTPTVTTARPTRQPAGRVEERRLRHEGFGYTGRAVWAQEPCTAPMLILGGSSQDRYSWVRHERWLTRWGSVLTVDLPGYGDGEPLPLHYGLDFLADATAGLVAEWKLPRVNLVGACFGGAVAVRLAQRHPELVERLVLVGMSTRLPEDLAEQVATWRESVAAGRLERIADEMVGRFVSASSAGVVRRQRAVTRFLYRQFLDQDERQLRLWLDHNERLVRHEWYRPAPRPTVPALVFTGEYDCLTPPEGGRELARQLPSARFTTLREADHLAPIERMEEFSELVGRFCGRQSLEGLPYCAPVEHFGPGSRLVRQGR